LTQYNDEIVNLRVVLDIIKMLLPYSFDISIFSDIDNPNLVDSINRIGVIFYENAI